eukprot:CAMPEP_0177263698 /NCGR_PEP_ID=MMETSP0367-20130122/61133_1 /TAXON_ID=447022 ORGANISM="Scrippsiella hangoei-like, Strain SHHI-4" /NCGR_SAMPLE_ID=MMETSP0367 /ASSEMBLY_ACC=CAM_ASM_000362 /LENGTH=67 /DNA_ID=CAMNT_0018718705 /DNA_START=260 /DNA_END=463 /DNA_ORIENTATION=-
MATRPAKEKSMRTVCSNTGNKRLTANLLPDTKSGSNHNVNKKAIAAGCSAAREGLKRACATRVGLDA